MANMDSCVSIIVPYYNRQNTLRKCLKSIFNQTYTNLEIILVNDGSTDNSFNVVNKFIKKDKRTINFNLEGNCGVSVARNKGLDIATGKYVVFVDSDDWLPRRAIEIMVSAIEKHSSDYVVGSMKIIEQARSSIDKTLDFDFFMQRPDFEFFNNQRNFMHIARKILKTDIINEFNIRLPEHIKCGEDTYFMLEYLRHCDKVSSISDCVYINNRLNVKTAGVGTFYPNRNLMGSEVMEKYYICIKEMQFSNNEKKTLITNYALISCNKICEHYLDHVHEIKTLMHYIKETFGIFDKYIDLDYCGLDEEFRARFLSFYNLAFCNDGNKRIVTKKSNLTFISFLKKIIKSVVGFIRRLYYKYL